MSEALNQWLESVRSTDPEFQLLSNEFVPWTQWTPPVAESKVALVTTGGVFLKHGLHQRFDLEAPAGDPTFREFPSVVAEEDLEVAHSGIDLGYARQDVNVLFPLERLRALAQAGYIGSVAPFAYSFMGRISRPVQLLSNYAPSVAYRMRRMGADLALVVATGGVDHQTAAIVARAIELAGVPTLVLGTRPEVLEAVKVPRAVVVSHPDGAPLGNPGNAGKHEHLIREALEAAWKLEGPGLIERLPFSWKG
ncbi:MAG: glycine/sarcosine/betaine reductase selenoprotein B family protein [Bacillota bacterium]